MIRKRNEQLAKTVIKGLQSRNMSGYYAEDKEAALKQALELIPEGSTIAMGGCMSAGEIGLISALEAGNYHYIDRSKMDARAGLMAAYDADIFLSSANAITSDGVMVNIDGNSNRVSCIAQGPRKVIFIVGMNKVCADLDSAMKRARNVAAPINAQRFDIKTPCKETGKCFDCKSPDTICCQFLITRYSRHTDRIHVILVNDRVDHAPAMTMEDCKEVDEILESMVCKNLFLCNRQETAFYLLMIPDTKVFHTKDLSAQIGSARLSFAKPEYMEKFLDITPGSVSVLGLMNDTEHQVKLLIDEEVLDSEYFGCHPCINTSSLRMRTADLIEKVLPAMGHDFVKVKL